MSENSRQAPSLFTHIDVTTTSTAATGGVEVGPVGMLLSRILAAQNRQNELMEQLIQQMSTAQRQRSAELGQWKQANPRLAQRCRQAAETLGQIQTQFLENVTEEIAANGDSMMDGEFMLNEFVDRFGPRLAHLNGVLQVLSQLSSMPASESGS
jgi:putative heme iron utilization protein